MLVDAFAQLGIPIDASCSRLRIGGNLLTLSLWQQEPNKKLDDKLRADAFQPHFIRRTKVMLLSHSEADTRNGNQITEMLPKICSDMVLT